eukprot:TRINITY_DN5_c0_g1_i1.p1 TRINITY_DN5_c0_g1~~TRINITY_DN5_c0_g1_i1.p1  ORF type:complete len:595 (+),score=146.79 TRINITY_DN5_c0_g1_i1:179-1963(+)
MEETSTAHSPDTSGVRGAFRKPLNDASRRKYRRHSPVSRSSSPSSSGGAKRGRSRSPTATENEVAKIDESSKRTRRNDDDSAVAYNHSHGRRDTEARHGIEKRSYGRNRDYHSRSDDQNYRHRYDNNEDRSYHIHHSHSGRDSGRSMRSEYSKREDYRNHREKGFDAGLGTKRETEKERDRDNGSRNYARIGDKTTSLDGSKIGIRQCTIDMEEKISKDKEGLINMGKEWNMKKEKPKDIDESIGGREKSRTRDGYYERGDRHRTPDDFNDVRDRRRSQRDYKEHSRDMGTRRSHDDRRVRERDFMEDRDDGRNQVRDKYKNSEKECKPYKDEKSYHRQREDPRERERGRDKYDKDSDRYLKNDSKGYYSKEKESRKERERDRPQDVEERGTRKGQECERDGDWSMKSAREGKQHGEPSDREIQSHEPFSEGAGQTSEKDTVCQNIRKTAAGTQSTQEPVGSAIGEADASHDLNAAKLAAMKAAEIVNKNLGVAGMMSTDQKKKLLWGNKKAHATVESGSSHIWDTARFDDPDRQEKFNKLMGVKGDLKSDQKAGEKSGGHFAEEKQKELQLDLEKQYTAGLRRRDGRTVGLGL